MNIFNLVEVSFKRIKKEKVLPSDEAYRRLNNLYLDIQLGLRC